MAKVRVIVQVDDETKQYIEEQSERLGISQSGFINFCIAQYKEQRESIAAMNNINSALNKLEELQRILPKE